MQKQILSLLLGTTLLFAITGCSGKKQVASVNNVGTFQTTDIYGNTVTEDIFRDYDLTVINTWATGCSPCIDEMPDLAELSELYKDKKVQIIGIVHDVADPKKGIVDEELLYLAQDIVERTGVNYPVLLPDNSLNEGLLANTMGYPDTAFVDSTGELVGISILGSQDMESWKEIIDERLAMSKGE